MKIFKFKAEDYKDNIAEITSPDGEVTMFLEGVCGGPIISGKNREEVKHKFNEALNLGCAVANLMEFTKEVKKRR